jgi:hypothetical protein
MSSTVTVAGVRFIWLLSTITGLLRDARAFDGVVKRAVQLCGAEWRGIDATHHVYAVYNQIKLDLPLSAVYNVILLSKWYRHRNSRKHWWN